MTLRLFTGGKEKTENLVKILHRDESGVRVHPVPAACDHVFTCYDKSVLDILCTQSACAHGDKIFRYVFGFYVVLVKQSHHHVVIGRYLIVGGIAAIIGVYLFTDIKRRMGRHETEAEQERAEQF